MRAVVVEVGAPCRHQIAGMAQAVEQMIAKQSIFSNWARAWWRFRKIALKTGGLVF